MPEYIHYLEKLPYLPEDVINMILDMKREYSTCDECEKRNLNKQICPHCNKNSYMN